MNPVMPILRERELLYILNFCEAKVFIVPKSYRGFDYAAMAQGMRGELPRSSDGESSSMAKARMVSSGHCSPPNLESFPRAWLRTTWLC